MIRKYVMTGWKKIDRGPEFVIIMVPFYVPQEEWDYEGYEDPLRGKRKQYLVQYKVKIKGKCYVDGEFISDWVQYK